MARVLLLEDDLDQLELRRLLLEGAGHRVETAVCASDAMAFADGPDVLVLDLVPGFEGVLSGLPAGVRVIVLSGRESVPQTVRERAACVLRKPCPTRMLMEAIGHKG